MSYIKNISDQVSTYFESLNDPTINYSLFKVTDNSLTFDINGHRYFYNDQFPYREPKPFANFIFSSHKGICDIPNFFNINEQKIIDKISTSVLTIETFIQTVFNPDFKGPIYNSFNDILNNSEPYEPNNKNLFNNLSVYYFFPEFNFNFGFDISLYFDMSANDFFMDIVYFIPLANSYREFVIYSQEFQFIFDWLINHHIKEPLSIEYEEFTVEDRILLSMQRI